MPMPRWWNGRHRGLKIPGPKGRAGSIPARGTIKTLSSTWSFLLYCLCMPRKKPVKVKVSDKMQKGYVYELTEPAGRNFNSEFEPELTPKQMLQMGIFCGRYMRDCKKEFPASWFKSAKFSEDPKKRDCKLNYFHVNASTPLSYWKDKGWIYKDDPRGWFQWYCRYYMGRRLPEEDERQIKRWKAFRRHIGQIKKNCKKGDMKCRPTQRQALLHWAYDSRKI